MSNKTLVLYTFHEYNSRVNKFINKAIFKDPNINFLVIVNNKSDTTVFPDYVKVIKRENTGYDFGAWSEGLLTNNLYKNYTHFIFANSSIDGPYLPENCSDTWCSFYINGLKNGVKLFGSTINTCNNPLHSSHVQSYIFSMEYDTLKYLIIGGIFSLNDVVSEFIDAIIHKEVAMSQKILQNNWNIGCLHPYYKDIDFTFKNGIKPGFEFLNDIMKPKYRNNTTIKGGFKDTELIFVKGNRWIDSDEWTFYKGYDSYGHDINYNDSEDIFQIYSMAMNIKECVAFNSYGFIKSKVEYPLKQVVESGYYNNNILGIYVKKSKEEIAKQDAVKQDSKKETLTVSEPDTIVAAVVKKFLQRSELGKKKYGVTLDRTDLKPHDWIQHAQEELMDGILYLEKLKGELSK